MKWNIPSNFTNVIKAECHVNTNTVLVATLEYSENDYVFSIEIFLRRDEFEIEKTISFR